MRVVDVRLVREEDGEPGLSLGEPDFTWNNYDDPQPGGGSLTFSLAGTDKDEILALHSRSCLAFVIDDGINPNTYITLDQPSKPTLTRTGAGTTITYGFLDLKQRFAETFVQPDGDTAAERVVTGTAGQIMSRFWNEAQDAGYLTELTRDWGPFQSSLGTPWTTVFTVTVTPFRTTLLDVIWMLYKRQGCEVVMRKRVMKLFAWGEKNEDGETADPPVIAQAGRDILLGERKADARGMANVVHVIGEDDRFATAEDEDSIEEYGRLERTITASTASAADLQAIADLAVTQFANPIPYRSFTMVIRQGDPDDVGHPYETYNPGDRIGTMDDDSSAPVVWGKVACITVAKRGTSIEASIALDHRRAIWEERTQNALDGLTRGAPESKPSDRKRMPPAAPTSLTFTTGTSEPGTGPQTAWLRASWAAPTTDADGQPLYDFDHFELQYRSSDGKWKSVNTGTDAFGKISALPLATTFDVRVYALDTARNVSTGLSGTSATAAGTGEMRSTDTAGASTLRVVGDTWHMTKVVGGAIPDGFMVGDSDRLIRLDTELATGPGVDLDYAQGVRTFGTGGALGVHIRTDGSSRFIGDMDIEGNLDVSGTTVIGGSTVIEGSTTIHDTLNIDGDTEIGGSLDITADLDVLGNTHLGGTLTLDSDLDASGQTISSAVLTGVQINSGDADFSTMQCTTGQAGTMGVLSLYSLLGTGTLVSDWSCTGDFAAVTVTETSARAGKADLRKMIDARRLLKVPTWTYRRARKTGEARQVGLMAEDVADAGLEELVTRDESGKPVGLKYSRIVAVLLEIVREQDERLQRLESQN